MAQARPKFFEDFAVGMTFASGTLDVDADQIVAFASEFDPQPFHLDPQAAQTTFFGSLVASGWHTAGLTMRLLLASDLAIAGGVIGAGGEITWPTPLRPGDRIHAEIEVIATRPLRSRPERGMITTRTQTITQTGAVVQVFVARLIVPRRVAEP